MSPFLSRAARVGAVLLALGLSACAGLGTPPDRSTLAASDSFALSARFALRVDAQNHSGRLDWRHTPARDEWLLSSPFGQGIAEIVGTRELACLSGSDGRRECDADLDALTRRLLGYPLPLAGLADWVRARPPVDGGAAAAGNDVLDALGRPLVLVRAGWRIEFAYHGEAPDALPRRLSVALPAGPELRLVIDEWRALGLPNTPSAPAAASSTEPVSNNN